MTKHASRTSLPGCAIPAGPSPRASNASRSPDSPAEAGTGEPKPPRAHRHLPRALREAPSLRSDIDPSPPRHHHALLINPFYAKDPTSSFGKHVLTPILSLTSVAAATPSDWSVDYWDENLLQGHPPYDPFPQVVGITVHLTFARRAYELAMWYRQCGAVVILGGLHAVSCPDEVAPHADAIAVGDGVGLWPRILHDIDTGTLQPRYDASFNSSYRDDPPPRREILPKRDFLTTTSLIATRGCHNRCGFCYLSTRGLHMPYRMRHPDDVAAEFAANGEPYGVFIDNNLGSRKDYLRDLCRALQPLDIIWSAAVTIDVTDEPDLVREMALSGCTGVFIGFESLTAQNLDDARKKTPRPNDYARRVEIFHRNGVAVNSSFVLGFDHDTPDVFETTIKWIEENRLECSTFHILTPYPGTPLFRQMEADGRILHRNWDLYDTAHVVFQPRHMSPQDLFDGYAWCYERLFKLRSMWRRRPARLDQLAPYLAGTILYKHGNYFWRFLIRFRLTHMVWKPLVGAARNRHLRFRRKLALESADTPAPMSLPLLPAWERLM